MRSSDGIVSADWLRGHAGDPDVRILDIRWYIDGASGLDRYREKHIPGAVYVDHDTEATAAGSGGGRHPLPEPDTFERAMRRAGVDRRTAVVAYDDQGGFVAARLWWTLRYFGHQRVAILDGGIPGWGGPWESGEVRVPEGDFAAGAPRADRVVDYGQVRRLEPGTVLLDARPPERYRGDEEPVDPKAGHIPGALNVPWERNVDGAGRFRPGPELRAMYAGLGIGERTEVVAYCGSGARACHVILALEAAGYPGARLYPGSWSDWCAHPDAPVEVGQR
ncbi:sulfurtransferase [Pseudonocardia eucalypti]|uniref:Sulfurtransferase n=1 Tax=Pseudonocardia eucalypti TaxID=648755 RepID=A0ABP9QC17_9PSEU|nr:thiosulfate/3-mercaptopyruvate sulfurtransferase [Pseudonocardia eucalypti]